MKKDHVEFETLKGASTLRQEEITHLTIRFLLTQLFGRQETLNHTELNNNRALKTYPLETMKN